MAQGELSSGSQACGLKGFVEKPARLRPVFATSTEKLNAFIHFPLRQSFSTAKRSRKTLLVLAHSNTVSTEGPSPTLKR